MPSLREKAYLNIVVWLAAALFVAGCASAHKTSSAQKGASRQHVDINAQQYYYDRGVQKYSRERYEEAEADFQRVIENGPGTTLGQRAQENIKKIQQILKTLEEIRAK